MPKNERLYIGTVTYKFPVVASTAQDAMDYLYEAIADVQLEDFTQIAPFTEGSLTGVSPKARVHGSEREVSLAEAIEQERHRQEMERQQIDLFKI